ncbi:MAG: LysM peptidoglycan-binding domain-containing protein [Tissierellaceae bacterium]|nr:LysM peptidoglycan-binding domain-containing protein [Tissierellaceae bacterium]
MKKYRIVNRQRFYFFMSFLLVMIFTTFFLVTNSKRVHSIVLNEDYREVRVSKGDTLWNIAEKNMPNKYDVRYLVYKLKEFNDLDTAYIYPGDTIKVPILNE